MNNQNIEGKIRGIINKAYANEYTIAPCPLSHPHKNFTHHVALEEKGIKVQCYQCGRSFVEPKSYTNEMKIKALTALLIAERTSLLGKIRENVIGEDEKEGIHDRCDTDSYSWCYDHDITIEDGELTTHTDRNQLRAEQRKALEAVGENKT